MSRFIILLIVFGAALSARGQTYGELREHIIREEGYSLKPYILMGTRHVGIGHRIYGVSRTLTKWQVEKLFAADLKVACDTAYHETKQFSRHPKQIRIMLVALAMNLGANGYHDFIRFRAAIDRFDYRAAGRELQSSLWATQLPNRAARYIDILNTTTHHS